MSFIVPESSAVNTGTEKSTEVIAQNLPISELISNNEFVNSKMGITVVVLNSSENSKSLVRPIEDIPSCSTKVIEHSTTIESTNLDVENKKAERFLSVEGLYTRTETSQEENNLNQTQTLCSPEKNMSFLSVLGLHTSAETSQEVEENLNETQTPSSDKSMSLGSIQANEDIPLTIRLKNVQTDEIKLKTSDDRKVITKTKKRIQKIPKKFGKDQKTKLDQERMNSVTETGESSTSDSKEVEIDPSFIGHDNDYEFDDDEEKFKCKKCNKFFKTRGSLLGHQRYICGKAPSHNCPFCRYKARSAIAVRVHVGRKHNCWPRLTQDHKWIY